jgi:hypothetical protein
VPTYFLTAELASCVVLRGALTPAPYPPRLVERAPGIWRFCRSFSLEYARAHARRGNRIGAIGQAAKAVIEEAHAVLAARGQWVCNEKRMIDLAGLADAHRLFDLVPSGPDELEAWIGHVALALDAGGDRVPFAKADATR